MIIGDGKLRMSESDFIELCTRMGNDDRVCCNATDCKEGCAECWAKYFSEFIIVE